MILRGALLGLLGASIFLVLGACGSSDRAGNGAECFVANDCVVPLVCVEQRDKSRRCTDNVDAVLGSLPPEAAAPESDAGDAGEPEAGEPPDSGPEQPDTGTTDQ